jgi:hypothetical protein
VSSVSSSSRCYSDSLRRSRLDSRRSKPRRRLEEECEARIEARVEAIHREYTKKLKDKARKQKVAKTRYNKWLRKLTTWLVMAHRALSALHEIWVQRKNGTLARIRLVLVQKGGRPGVWRRAAGMSCRGLGGGGGEWVDSPVLREAPVVGFAAPNVGLLVPNLARANAAGSSAGCATIVWGYGCEAALRLAGKLLLRQW